MQLEPRNIHVSNGLGSLQCVQEHPQSFGMLRLNSSKASGFKEALRITQQAAKLLLGLKSDVMFYVIFAI